MTTRACHRTDGQVIWHDTEVLPLVSPTMFDTEWHRERGTLIGSAEGRGQAHFLRLEGQDVVLRPYRRGGLIGKLVKRLYLRFGAERSRAFREYTLLEWMQSKGLSVPRPVAARYAPVGLFYRAELITGRITDATSLAESLRETELSLEKWAQIGELIAKMHALGVDHTDLNCRNILLDANGLIWLIDFDKCQRRTPGAWQSANLARLRRSLEKEKLHQTRLFYSDAEWGIMLDGYRCHLQDEMNASIV